MTNKLDLDKLEIALGSEIMTRGRNGAHWGECVYAHWDCAQRAMLNELRRTYDIEECYHKLLDDLWQLLYPDKTDWEYPGEVLNHIRAELEILGTKNTNSPPASSAVLVFNEDNCRKP